MLLAISALIVLLSSRLALAAAPGMPAGLDGLAAAMAHDALAALAIGAALWRLRPRALAWALYGLVAAYVAVNVPVARTLGSPLTLPMLRAARGALADSIVHHATPLNLGLIVLVAAAAAAAPLVLRRLPPRALRAAAWTLIGGAGLFWLAAGAGLETWGGRERNAITALLRSLAPRAPDETAGAAPLGTRSALPSAQASRDPLLESLRSRASGRSVVITVLESTGAGYLGIHGAAPDPMPRLSRLSASALVFESAYCTYPESIKSLMAVLCSRYPALDVPAEAYAGLRTPALPEILGREGYAAALLHSGRFGYLGMDAVIGGRGFDVLEDAGAIGGERESSFGIDEASTVRRALAWIDSLPPERPFLLVYLPTAGHHPYAAAGPRPFPEREDRDAYLNDLHVADDALGRLLDGLEARGRSERTLIAVLGDHGEAFGQHPGNYGHSLALYEENVRVPFLIALPGLLDSPRRVAAPASTIDLAPTLLDLLGMAAPAAFQGASLLGSAPPRPALFFADYDRGLLGLRDREWKCIHELESGVTALFDLAQDPAETRDLATELPERVEDYVRGLKEWCAAQRRAIIVEARGP